MNNILSDESFTLLLVGFVITLTIIGLDLLFNKRIVYIISLSLLLVSIITLLCSIFFIGGWTGMGIGFYCVSVFIGSLVGILLVALTSLMTKVLFKKKV